MHVGSKLSVIIVKSRMAVRVMHSKMPPMSAVRVTTVMIRRVGAVRRKVCEKRSDEMWVKLSLLERGTHHDLGQSCMQNP